MKISEDLREELDDVLTTRRKWWVIKFDDAYYGEVWDDDMEGFDMKLFSKKEDAHNHALEFLEGVSLPYRIVEICLQDVR